MERAEAIKIIKTATVYTPEEMEALETLIPELRESEDERMMRVISLSLTDVPEERFTSLGTTLKDCLAWLEKQNHDGKKWLTPAELNRLEALRYEAGFNAGVRSEKEKKKEQKPAKKQDYSGLNELERAIHRGFLAAGVENVPVTIIKETAQDCLSHLPAEWDEYTKTNLDRALQIIEKAKGTLQGYQSDDGIYECDKAIECLEHFLYRGLEIEKPAEWSEEDETYLQDALWCVEKAEKSCKDEEDKGACWSAKRWLKSLPERKTLQPKQEWSEEDEKMRDRIIDILNRTFSVYSALGTSSTRPSCPTYKDEVDWLKSLRPRWRPSEEQMNALLGAEGILRSLQYDDRAKILASIYEQLKKLM